MGTSLVESSQRAMSDDKEDLPDVVALSDNSTSTSATPTLTITEGDCDVAASDVDQKIPPVVGTCDSFKRLSVSSLRWESERDAATVTDKPSEQKNDQVRVLFGQIEWKEYGMILGDHPETQGAPLTLEWHPLNTKKDTVDHYEETRGPRRTHAELAFNPLQRSLYLSHCTEATKEEIDLAIKQSEDVKRKRLETLRDMKNEKFNIFLESAKRKTGRFISKTIYPKKGASMSSGGSAATPAGRSGPSSSSKLARTSRKSFRPLSTKKGDRGIASFHGEGAAVDTDSATVPRRSSSVF